MVNRNTKDSHPNWRPNFCITAALPDIKAVRTNFIINFVFVTAALIFIFYALEREYRAYALGQRITNMQQRIDSDGVTNSSHLKLSNDFKAASLEIVDLERFFAAPLKVHVFLAKFAELCPVGLTIQSIGFAEIFNKAAPGASKVLYRMNVSGEVDDPLMLDDFKSAVEVSKLFEVDRLKPEINDTLQARNEITRIFPYRMSIELVPQEKQKGAK